MLGVQLTMNSVRQLASTKMFFRVGLGRRAVGALAVLGAILGCCVQADGQAVQPQPPLTIDDARQQIKDLELTITLLPSLTPRGPAGTGTTHPTDAALNKEIAAKQRQLQAIVKEMDRDFIRAIHAQDYQAELSQSYLRDFAKRREAAYSTIQTLAGREISNVLRESIKLERSSAPRPPIQANLSHAQSIQTEFLSAFGDKIAATAAQLGKDHPQVRELEARYDRLSTMVGQVVEAYQKAQTATTKTEESFYLSVANSMEDSINRVAHGVFDKSPFPERPPAGATGPELIQGIDQSLYRQQQMLLNWKEDAPRQNNAEGIILQAEQAFGEGRAGAGAPRSRAPD